MRNKMSNGNIRVMSTLDRLPVGGAGIVDSITDSGRVTRRLMEMGVVPGAVIRIVKAAPFGDPIEVRLLGYSLALRRNEAASIHVMPVDLAASTGSSTR